MQHRSRRRPRRRPPSPPPHTKNTHSIETCTESNASEFARIIKTPVRVSRHIPLLTVAAHPGWEENETTLQKVGNKRTANQGQNQSTLPRATVVTLKGLHRQKNLQLNSATSLTRDSDKRSLPSEEKGMSEPPHTALLSVEILPRADCKHDAQTSSARSSSKCAHLPQRFSASETFHQTKGNGK